MNEISGDAEDRRQTEPTVALSAAHMDSPRPSTAMTAEEMGSASFPASDPPATWTWDPR